MPPMPIVLRYSSPFPIFLRNYQNKCAHLGLDDGVVKASQEEEENEHLGVLGMGTWRKTDTSVSLSN